MAKGEHQSRRQIPHHQPSSANIEGQLHHRCRRLALFGKSSDYIAKRVCLIGLCLMTSDFEKHVAVKNEITRIHMKFGDFS